LTGENFINNNENEEYTSINQRDNQSYNIENISEYLQITMDISSNKLFEISNELLTIEKTFDHQIEEMSNNAIT